MRRGLYDSAFEHDACGIGLLCNLDGEASHQVITDAVRVLESMAHRGGAGSDPLSGDGAGILLQIPHDFFAKICENEGIALPARGRYGVGMLFCSKDDARAIAHFRGIAEESGLLWAGMRDVPVDASCLGLSAREALPRICQIFLAAPEGMEQDALEKALYVAMRRAEDECRAMDAYFYFASLSSRTIVYKGMLHPAQLTAFYLDLLDVDMRSAVALVHSRFSTNTFPSWEKAHPHRLLIHNGEINTLRGNVQWAKARGMRLSETGSDSAILDEYLHALHVEGLEVPEALMRLIPEPWENATHMPPEKRAFYEYHAATMEPWDGPAAIGFCDGRYAGAMLDRNGLRPVRYTVTKDNRLILASEAGVLPVSPGNVLRQGMLAPGGLLLVDLQTGLADAEEYRRRVAEKHPYGEWVRERLSLQEKASGFTVENAEERMAEFGYTREDKRSLREISRTGAEPISSMNDGRPLAALSAQPRLLYDYFHQSFAQVTNPPMDALREKHVVSAQVWLGERLWLESPVLSPGEMEEAKSLLPSATLPIFFGEEGLEAALEGLFAAAKAQILRGKQLLILSDREGEGFPMPALLAVSGLHHFLLDEGLRLRAALLVDSGEPRESHHIAALLGFGANAVCPWLAMTVAGENFQKAALDGVVKIASKMGISTLRSYTGAQLFEALGISGAVCEKYFCGVTSRVGGADIRKIEADARNRSTEAPCGERDFSLLRDACQSGDYALYKEFARAQSGTLRSLLGIRTREKPLPLSLIEPVESIVQRFRTGAMSFGSLSREAHECIAVAMNRLGGKSNSGEGGELSERFGTEKNSAVKQVASGRFGVDIHYLGSAVEIQIKMAQGAKPGEGGHLPGGKVSPDIARARGSKPGVGLISPPPHHDIYSIEDLAQLIYDLRCANPRAKIGVKLASEAGVGTVAVGVAKGLADSILLSGFDGGTGAATRGSIEHAGLPWELGLAEAHQTLLLNGMRGRVRLEADGRLFTGRDVLVAALLGAEDFGFATAPLIALGCRMDRACHLGTCPAGIATQDEERRKRFAGKPEYVENLLRFIAEDLREWMAKIGAHTVDELVGRTEFLYPLPSGLDLTPLLYQPQGERRHGILPAPVRNMDSKLIRICRPALEEGRPVSRKLEISNRDRAVGTMLSGEISRKFGQKGLPENTIRLDFIGTAGQSFGAFAAPGLTLTLYGAANDYVGKGLSGGTIILRPEESAAFIAHENIIAGNVALYGATSGKAFFAGRVGERFAVRNSGAIAVCEGAGGNACEYMTGGVAVILGPVGANFGAGMSGGKAFLLDYAAEKRNTLSGEEAGELRLLLAEYLAATGSELAKKLLADWDISRFALIKPENN